MPAWLLALAPKAADLLVTLALRYALPAILTYLQKHGHINAVQELAGKGAAAIVQDVRDTKTYSDGQKDFPDDPTNAKKNNPFG